MDGLMKHDVWIPEVLPKILLCPHKTEAKDVEAYGRAAGEAIGRTKAACIEVPATAT